MPPSKKFRSYAIQSMRRIRGQLEKQGEFLMILREQYGDTHPEISDPLAAVAAGLVLCIDTIRSIEGVM